MGTCPCPRCCIPLNRVHQMGMPRDRNQRITLARVDDTRRQNLVAEARRIIYEKQYQVNSAAVEALLRNESLTPNVVCLMFASLSDMTLILCRTLSPIAWGHWVSTSSRHCYPMKCTKLDWEYGALCSCTFCEYYSQKTKPSF